MARSFISSLRPKIMILWAFVMVAPFYTTSLALADAVTVKTSTTANYGRLSFRWPQPVGHVAKRQGNRLVVSFSRPIQADLRPVIKGLGAYVASIEPAPNNASVAFRIKGNFTVRSYDSGSVVVVDVVRASNPGASKTSPAQTQGQTVSVRTGVHPNYSRVVFEWPNKTGFTLSRSQGTATMTFDKAGNVNLASLVTGKTKNIDDAATAIANGQTTVTMTVADTSKIKAFASGRKIVVDVFASGTQKSATTVQPPAPKPSPVIGVANAAPTPAPTPAHTPTTAPTSSLAPHAAPVALVPDKAKPSAAASPPSSKAAAQKPIAKIKRSGPLLKTSVKSETLPDGAVDLTFVWDEPVAAAVFRRSNTLWVVFDKNTEINTHAVVKGSRGLVTSAEQVLSNVGTALRLTTPNGINPSIKRSGLSWILEFAQQDLVPTAPLKADAQPDSPLGARLFVSVPEPGNVVAFQDPEIGDNLVVVPVIPLNHGVSKKWRFPQLQLLASKQGVVIKPKSDDLRIRSLRQGVEISSSGTLQISSVSAEQKANVDLQSALSAGVGMQSTGPLTRVLSLEKWKRKDLQDFNKIRQDLQNKIAAAKGTRNKERARHELVGFYFSNGLEAEALGVLEAMRQDRPEIENEPEFRMLRGGASWLMERYADARKDLFHASLDGNDEGIFWRALVVADEEGLANSAYELRKVGAITQPYPSSIKMPTALKVAEAAVELGDVKQAGQYIEVLNVDGPTRSQKDQIDFVSGKLKELSGDVDGAIADWEHVMDGVHRFSRAKAAVARTELLLSQGSFTPKDAIEEYEKLRFVWRGDKFEFALLIRLGNLYLGEQKYREGLTAFRQAVTYFPKESGANQVTKKMSDAFMYLYMENGADVLPPITAIALYDEFRELTPAGALGDEMIRKLADRLVGIDLLDRAAALLESQVGFRLVGEERGRVGARLALIYLFNRKYQESLDSLDKSEVRTMSDTLKAERVLLRAHAHIGLGHPNVALDLLVPETNLAAERVRAGIYWRAKDWKLASKSMTKIVRFLKAKIHTPLNEEQALAVLSAATAYTLDGNEVAVSRITGSYAQAMAQTQYADVFRLMTDAPVAGLVNYRGLTSIVKKVTSFQDFMMAYKQRVANGQLSSLY